jgi:polyferredoxin
MKTATAPQKQRSVKYRKRERTSQTIRFYSQLVSFAINVLIGVQFWLWVRYIDSGGSAWKVSRPPGVEGWLPIGSLVSLRYWFETNIVNEIHPAAMIILATIIATAFLFKEGFCSWICPVGFVSELLGNISDKLFRHRIRPPRWLDYPLRSLKYFLLAFFIWAVFISMTPDSTKAFLYSDYNIVSDILMLRFFADISTFALSVIVGLFLLSLVVRGFWCRYLCPYGALLGLFSFLSPTRIRRNEDSCIDCSACARACPSFIKVDRVKEVISDECTGCMACVDACPVNKTLEIRPTKRMEAISPVKWAAVLLVFFWGTLFVAKLIGPWQNAVTDQQYMERMDGVRRGEYVHPKY